MRIYLCLVIISVLISSSMAQEQQDVLKVKTRYGYEINRRPAINFNIFVNNDHIVNNPHVSLAVAIQNDVLQFERKGSEFKSAFQTTIAIRSKEGEQTILTETFSEDVVIENFEETNSRHKYQYKLYKLTDLNSSGIIKLVPGEYECLLEIRDLISKKTYNSKRPFSVKKKSAEEKYQTSEVTFLIKNPTNIDDIPLLPSFSAIDFAGDNYAYLRLMAVPDDSLVINVRMYRTRKLEDQLIHQEFISVIPDSEIADIIYKMPSNLLEEGEYKIRFSTGGEKYPVNQVKEFSVVWFTKPVYLYRTDLALRPMKYLLKEDELKNVKKMNADKMTAWFTNYWKEKDPSPETVYNELQDEFYQRVDEANRKFLSRFKEGWETDRGQIFLLYGEPQKIENRRYATSTVPYIVWLYNEGKVSFIFVDQDKNGEFRLLKNVNGKE
ncbi:MAG: GWxTD domain-containing protein [Calditrichaceae bacterium]